MSVLAIAALFFVIGVIINAIAVCVGVPPWGNKLAWFLWAVAAILWYVVTFGIR